MADGRDVGAADAGLIAEADSAHGSSLVLEMRGIGKSYGGTRALQGVDFAVRPGSVHGLIGENGAGKSTLMKILSGAVKPDEGTIFLRGHTYLPDGPADAKSLGVSMVYQELALAPHLTVAENLTLGWERSRFGILRTMENEVRQVLELLDESGLQPDIRVQELGIGSRQMIEIGRALLHRSVLVVLDEPTAGLSQKEVATLYRLIARLKSEGATLVYISHFLEEVMTVCDDFTVLRDGRTVAQGVISETSIAELVTMMTGRRMDAFYPASRPAQGARAFRFEVDAARGVVPGTVLEVARGEILGIAGLVGAGRSELLRSLFGINGATQGRVHLDRPSEFENASGEHGSRMNKGKEWNRGEDRKTHVHDLSGMTPGKAMALGYGLMSEDRKSEGLALRLSVADNFTFPFLSRYRNGVWLSLAKRMRDVLTWMQELGVKADSAEDSIDSLSGGNQQKVALGRLLRQDLRLLLLDEPTRGVDVGAKSQIYELVHEAAHTGAAVVVVSSYQPELFGICSSLMVMHKGRLSRKRPIDQWTPESVMAFAATGNSIDEVNIIAASGTEYGDSEVDSHVVA